MFLSDSPLSQAQRDYENEQTLHVSTVPIHITAPAPFTTQDMTALRALSLDLEFVGGVTAVASPFLLRWPPTEGAPSGTPLFGADIEDGFADDLAKFEHLGTNLPTFLSDGLSGMLISVAMDTDKTTLADAMASISAELDRSLPLAMTATIAGKDVISAEIVSGLKADLIALNLWGAAITALAAIALLRDVRMGFLAVGPAIVGAAGVLALSVWLGYPITVLSNVIPILLLVLGVADSVHLAGHLKAKHTVREVVKTVGPACALTALTTAVAFAGIMLTGNVQLFEFAVLGVLGTMLSFAIVIVTFVLLAGFIVPTSRPIPQGSAAIALRFATFGAAKPRVTISLCLLLLVISTVSFAQTKAWFPLY